MILQGQGNWWSNDADRLLRLFVPVRKKFQDIELIVCSHFNIKSIEDEVFSDDLVYDASCLPSII